MRCKWGLFDLVRSRAKGPERVERGVSWGPQDKRENEELPAEFGQHTHVVRILFAHWQSCMIGGG